MGLEISLVDARTGFMVGRIFKTKYAGNGVKLFNESGRYRLRISSSFTNWNFKVSQVSQVRQSSTHQRSDKLSIINF